MNTTLGTVLLVEDEQSLRRLVASFLRGSSYEVVEAADGPDGVERFVDSGPFDLVLLDLNLPGYSGVEVCRRIRDIEPDQPVLICSAAIVPEAEDALLSMGVGDHLTKPYHPDALLGHVARMLRPKSSPGPSRVPAAGTLLPSGLSPPMGYEVEVKYRCNDPSTLADSLRAGGAVEGDLSEYADLYLAHPGRDFAATDEALRLRRVGNENRITYKGPKLSGPTKTREEIELPLTPGQEAFEAYATLFERLGFRRVAVVAKTRREFQVVRLDRQLSVTIDDAGPLGNYAEVEALAAGDADLADAQAAVTGLAQELGLIEVEPRSYLRMTLERA